MSRIITGRVVEPIGAKQKEDRMKLLGKSWRTSMGAWWGILAGTVTLVAIPFLDGDPTTKPDFNTWIALVGPAIGLMKARDNKVTSEEAGATP